MWCVYVGVCVAVTELVANTCSCSVRVVMIWGKLRSVSYLEKFRQFYLIAHLLHGVGAGILSVTEVVQNFLGFSLWNVIQGCINCTYMLGTYLPIDDHI